MTAAIKATGTSCCLAPEDGLPASGRERSWAWRRAVRILRGGAPYQKGRPARETGPVGAQ